MRDRLPVHIENRELPKENNFNLGENREYSYGYVNILYIVSILITVLSVLTVLVLGNR